MPVPALPPASGPGDNEFPRDTLSVYRRVVVFGLILFFLAGSAIGLFTGHAPAAKIAFLVPGTVAFILLVFWSGLRVDTQVSQQAPWPRLVMVVVLAIALFAVGGLGWLTALAIAAAVCGRFSATPRPAAAGAGVCGAAGVVVAFATHLGVSNVLVSAVLPVMAAFFAYSAARRNETLIMLQRTRAELARAAAAEERLRIARDLHDLLGHSLSLITLKAELAGRVIESDPQRAGREVADLEAVARRSLGEVRQAVAGYRQPDFAGELAAARELLTAAGIETEIIVPASLRLSPAADALLAWAVREGVTNVVRHSSASKATITAAAGQDGTVVDIADDGTGPRQPGTALAPAGIVVSIPARTGGPAAAPADGQAGRPGPGVPRPGVAGLAGSALPGPGRPGSGLPGPGRPGFGLPGPALPGPALPGPGLPGSGLAGPGVAGLAGSGLAGLAERISALGGELSAGPLQPRGFRLRITIPADA